MTAEELHQLAIQRHGILRNHRWSAASLRVWLDDRVQAGWLTKIDDRYYLTPTGQQIAEALTTIDSLEEAA